MRITAAWLHQIETQSFCRAVEAAGYKIWFVGGCVRNAVLGQDAADCDLATNAVPETILQIAKAMGFSTVPTGLAHGTVTVLAGSMPLEVTTLRRDVETFGRHATVVFSDDLNEDAMRRDFTMNTLYASLDGQVIDPLGCGVADALARNVRFVGDARTRIAEDYLRILRFFRFYATFGASDQGIDQEGLAACAERIDGLRAVSKERVGAEMRKLLNAANPAPAVASMCAAGVLLAIIPGADPTSLALLVHMEAGIAPRWQRRLALIGGQDLAENLRLSRNEAHEIARIKDEIGSTNRAAALGWLLGPSLALDVLLLRAVVFEQAFDWDQKSEIERGVASRFPVTAADLMPELSGPALGHGLARMKSRWLASELSLTRAELLQGPFPL